MDAQCEKNLNKVELRRAAVPDGGGAAQLDLLVGSERAFPLRVMIGQERLAVDLHLAEIKRTSAILAAALGETDDTPDVLKGTRAVRADQRGAQGGVVRRRDPADGRGGTEAGQVRSGRAAFRGRRSDLQADRRWRQGHHHGCDRVWRHQFYGSWDPKGNAAANTDLHLVMAGLTGQITFTQATNDVKLTGLGFGPGPTYVEVRGRRIFSMDLNQQGGRASIWASPSTPRTNRC